MEEVLFISPLPSRPSFCALQQTPTCGTPSTRRWCEGCEMLFPQRTSNDHPHCLGRADKGFCAGVQDVVSARVYTCAIKRKLLLACGQARTKAEFTQSQKRDLSHEGETTPAPSAASGTKKPRRNRLCGMCRGCCGVPSSGF